MLHALRKRIEKDEDGFTLIELMVVVLIIAILLAIAIPTFLGARDRANDRAAQSSLRNALTAAKTFYTDAQTFVGADETAVTGLVAIEPSLTYKDQAVVSDDFKIVSVHGTATEWAAAAWSKSKTCYFIHEIASGGTKYGKTTVAADCTADKAMAAAGSAF